MATVEPQHLASPQTILSPLSKYGLYSYPAPAQWDIHWAGESSPKDITPLPVYLGMTLL